LSVKIKICGITNLSDAENIAELYPDFLGFIMYQKSPRYIKPKYAREIVNKVHRFARTVGVFVNEAPDDVIQYSRYCGFDFVQLHGDEPKEDIVYLEKQGLKVIKAFRVKDRNILKSASEYPGEYILFDAFKRGEYGGTGKSIDKGLLMEISNNNVLMNKKLFLSGGLYSGNVRDVLSILKPYAVDASSSLESSPGIKDIGKVKAFINEVRSFSV